MRIATAQFSARPGDITANVATMAAFVREAAASDARLTVFAELTVTGYELELLTASPGLWMSGPDDPRLTPVRAACRETGTAAVVNCASAGRLMTFVYGPEGSPLTTYAKRHLFEGERKLFEAGSAPGRFTLDGTRIALATCYDNHFPALAAEAVADGCGLWLASSLYGVGGGEEERSTLYPALARDFGLPVVLANHAGPAGPWTGCGRSAVWGAGGGLLAEAPAERPGLALADVPLVLSPLSPLP
ncbi:carbon-nitrogen hydrolase family protein [Streptomyces sp. NBC_00237]|uniref:carbon-nitrogen hydrolase family protein n=1 Tax=Streptomyces sp. NBC_00237 TaxID=2975687 RepID=UPI002253A5C4|nr:carbon-nitrogen hydrolase family protein [Streptomyces sp. NBC_00237]MCX5201393.1 carbon-nitrogen hydrolase family protein [Streptomyces sp. NBC_00237]